MDNIIRVDFSKKNDTAQQEVPGITVDCDLTAYLDSLREMGIDEDDILDTFDAIHDYQFYRRADEIVRQFADGWFNQII